MAREMYDLHLYKGSKQLETFQRSLDLYDEVATERFLDQLLTAAIKRHDTGHGWWAFSLEVRKPGANKVERRHVLPSERP